MNIEACRSVIEKLQKITKKRKRKRMSTKARGRSKIV